MFRKYSGANIDLTSEDATDSTIDLDEAWIMCQDYNVYDDNLTKKGIIRPFTMSRDTNSRIKALKFVSFFEFVVRIACIKFGVPELADLGGRVGDVHGDSGTKEDSVRACIARLMGEWFP